MRTDLPQPIQELFFDFHWHHSKLIAAEGELGYMLFEELKWNLQLPIWQRFPDQKIFDLSPHEVLNSPAIFEDHCSRIEQANLEFPLIIMPNKATGRWTIMDGYHRLAKYHLCKIPLVYVKKLDRKIIDQIQKKVPFK